MKYILKLDTDYGEVGIPSKYHNAMVEIDQLSDESVLMGMKTMRINAPDGMMFICYSDMLFSLDDKIKQMLDIL